MSLETQLQNFATAVVTDVRDISNSIAGAANAKNATVQGNLNTTAKNLVDAVNELKASLDAAVGVAVTDVNGVAGPGAITVGTDDVAEGTANLYLTEARVLASVLAGYAAGAGTVSATDSVIAAIQKLDGNISAIDITAIIDDNAASATTTYSGNKIDADIASAVASLVNGSQATLDTLAEIAAALGNDENFATTVTTSLGLKANAADVKTVTELGATVDTRDYASEYVAARDA